MVWIRRITMKKRQDATALEGLIWRQRNAPSSQIGPHSLYDNVSHFCGKRRLSQLKSYCMELPSVDWSSSSGAQTVQKKDTKYYWYTNCIRYRKYYWYWYTKRVEGNIQIWQVGVRSSVNYVSLTLCRARMRPTVESMFNVFSGNKCQ